MKKNEINFLRYPLLSVEIFETENLSIMNYLFLTSKSKKENNISLLEYFFSFTELDPTKNLNSTLIGYFKRTIIAIFNSKTKYVNLKIKILFSFNFIIVN